MKTKYLYILEIVIGAGLLTLIILVANSLLLNSAKKEALENLAASAVVSAEVLSKIRSGQYTSAANELEHHVNICLTTLHTNATMSASETTTNAILFIRKYRTTFPNYQPEVGSIYYRVHTNTQSILGLTE